jgi:hypothetical protein
MPDRAQRGPAVWCLRILAQPLTEPTVSPAAM